MFLIKAIKNYFYPPVHTILVLGLDNSGKTTLLHMLNDRIRLGIMPCTMARQYNPNQIFNEILILENMQLIAVDLGHLIYPRMRTQIQALNIEGIVFMVDLSDKARFQEAVDSLKQIIQHIHHDQIPVVILGNKEDKKDAITLSELSTIFSDVHQFKSLKVFTCSIVKRLGLREPFEWFRTQFQQ